VIRTISSVLVIVALVGSSSLPVGAVSAQQAEGYAGTHVTFETSNNAIVDYAVDGETVVESMAVRSQSEAESRGDVRAGVGLSAVTNLTGAALSLDSRTEVSATVTVESGARMQAHDNARGILVVRSGGESQYVTANVSSSSRVESEGDRRVIVTTDSGTEGTFLVVGDGEVTVNERGNVSANLGSNGKLVFRSYSDGRDDDDKQEERLISEGKAAAEVYVMRKAEQGSDLAADVVQYSEDTTVEVIQKNEGTVEMTAERSREQGRIIITSVSEQAIGSVEELQVTVDGEAAERASSYSELENAADNGDSSKFLVRQRSNAQASADVLVAIDHFSTREVTMSEGSDGADGSGSDGSGSEDGSGSGDGSDSDGSDGEDERTTGSDGAGFGIAVAFVALISVALYTSRRI
jgi:PGF-CTERM protein